MPITKKNHYNPCFWTAFWNSDYYYKENVRTTQNPRTQKVFSLNLIGDKIIPTKTENVFFEKGMGLSKISADSVTDYAERNNDSLFNKLENIESLDNNDLLIDFENFFSTMEDLIKEPLLSVINKNEINTIAEKTHIASFIFDLIIRNYKNFNRMISRNDELNKPKFELFWNLKNDFSNPEVLKNAIIPIVASEWILYKTKKFKFPLGDQSVLINDRNALIALSPILLLKIKFKKKVSPTNICKTKKRLSFLSYRDFMHRTIKSSCREIIFSNKQLLLDWKETRVYRNRVAKLKF